MYGDSKAAIIQGVGVKLLICEQLKGQDREFSFDLRNS